MQMAVRLFLIKHFRAILETRWRDFIKITEFHESATAFSIETFLKKALEKMALLYDPGSGTTE